MSLTYRLVLALSDACDRWQTDYDNDSYYAATDPAQALMDGTQDEEVISCAATVLASAGYLVLPGPTP